MRETVEAFERRAGQAYQPMIPAGRPFAPRETCPTLFRYAGPCGMREGLDEGIQYLGPIESSSALLADVAAHPDSAGAAFFGTLAVLAPLWLHPVVLASGAPLVVGVANHRVPEAAAIAWIPPGCFHLDWDRLATPDDVRAAIPGYASSRRRVHEDLLCYLDELDAMSASGAPGPGVSWCTIPLQIRRSLLARYGVSSRWTLARRAA
jgi:hypothetical protein